MQTAKESTNRIGPSSPPVPLFRQAGRQVSRVSADSSIGSRVRVGGLGAWHYLQVTRKPDVNGSSCRMRPGSGTKEEIKICRHKTARFEFWRDFWLRLCINFRLPARGWRGGVGGGVARLLGTVAGNNIHPTAPSQLPSISDRGRSPLQPCSLVMYHQNMQISTGLRELQLHSVPLTCVCVWVCICVCVWVVRAGRGSARRLMP